MAADFIFDNSGDIAAKNGDFVIYDSLEQEVGAIIMANKADYKQTPLLGPSIIRFMKGQRDILKLQREVAIAMEMDNKRLNTIALTTDNQLKVVIK